MIIFIIDFLSGTNQCRQFKIKRFANSIHNTIYTGHPSAVFLCQLLERNNKSASTFAPFVHLMHIHQVVIACASFCGRHIIMGTTRNPPASIDTLSQSLSSNTNLILHPLQLPVPNPIFQSTTIKPNPSCLKQAPKCKSMKYAYSSMT